MTVPVPIPTNDGRHFADGRGRDHLRGRRTARNRGRLASRRRHSPKPHELTHGWPQRPGWRSSTDLLHAETGTKIDLGAMPLEGVARCRAAWARLTGRERCVVHGDPNSGNIRMTADRVALVDCGRDARRRPRPRPRCCRTTPPDSTTKRTTLPRRHGPRGKLPSAGTPAGRTSSQSSGSPKFERSSSGGSEVACGLRSFRASCSRPLVFARGRSRSYWRWLGQRLRLSHPSRVLFTVALLSQRCRESWSHALTRRPGGQRTPGRLGTRAGRRGHARCRRPQRRRLLFASLILGLGFEGHFLSTWRTRQP